MDLKKDRDDTPTVAAIASSLTLGSLTHVGMKRSSNEDSHCALVGPNAPPGSDALLAVADGMGGHAAGEVASAMAIQGIRSRLSRDGLGEASQLGALDYERLMKQVVQDLNSEVREGAQQPATMGMGTTLTTALILGPLVIIAHVGDSRAYLFRKGKMQQLSQDHSWVAEEVARGAITESQAREHPRRNILTRALGVAADVEVDTSAHELEEGDVLLLCSDGLHGLVGDEEIARTSTAFDPQEACEVLVQRANDLGGNDNVTVVIVRIDRLGDPGIRSYDQQERHQQTTVNMAAEKSSARGIPRPLKILLSPIWVPAWLAYKLARLLFRAAK
jgi:protein phosphatase